MDLLSQRYASPFLILDEFIRLQQLHEFVVEIIGKIASEKVREARWQYYLHRVYDMSFEEYVRRCEKPEKEDQGMTHKEIRNIINDSKRMVEGFIPS